MAWESLRIPVLTGPEAAWLWLTPSDPMQAQLRESVFMAGTEARQFL